MKAWTAKATYRTLGQGRTDMVDSHTLIWARTKREAVQRAEMLRGRYVPQDAAIRVFPRYL